MPRIAGTTDSQSAFLRAFRLHQGGPPPAAWPSPAILRRWLRHDGFHRAFTDLQRTLKTALSFQSLTTGLAAAQHLHASLHPDGPDGPDEPPAPEIDNPNSQIAIPLNPEPRTLNPSQRFELQRERLRHRTALTCLRLAHARLTRPPRRRPTPPRKPVPPLPKPDTPEDEETVEEAARRLMHPDCRPEVAIAFLKGEPHPDRAREEAEEAARAAAAVAGNGAQDASTSRANDYW